MIYQILIVVFSLFAVVCLAVTGDLLREWIGTKFKKRSALIAAVLFIIAAAITVFIKNNQENENSDQKANSTQPTDTIHVVNPNLDSSGTIHRPYSHKDDTDLIKDPVITTDIRYKENPDTMFLDTTHKQVSILSNKDKVRILDFLEEVRIKKGKDKKSFIYLSITETSNGAKLFPEIENLLTENGNKVKMTSWYPIKEASGIMFTKSMGHIRLYIGTVNFQNLEMSFRE